MSPPRPTASYACTDCRSDTVAAASLTTCPSRSGRRKSSTARGVVHGADCAVLVVRPPASLNVSYPLLEPEREPIPRKQWAAALARFTGLNAGRLVTTEVEDPGLGAQVQVTDYALLGVDYDVRSERVEIMVGDFASTQPHLTRNISDVRSVHILPDATGRDWILRVAHGRGQTVLTLHR